MLALIFHTFLEFEAREDYYIIVPTSFLASQVIQLFMYKLQPFHLHYCIALVLMFGLNVPS